jgi:hypothetical protein
VTTLVVFGGRYSPFCRAFSPVVGLYSAAGIGLPFGADSG